MFKKIISSILVATMMLGLGTTVFAEELNINSDQLEVISGYFDSINNDDWERWSDYYAPDIRSAYTDFACDSINQTNNLGILTVNGVELLDIQKTDNEKVPKYRELEQYYLSGNYICYKVSLNLTVDQETKYFTNGIQERIIVLVNNNNHWYIGASSKLSLSKERGVGQGFLDGNLSSPPSTITVDQHDGSTWAKPSVVGKPVDVNFNTFVKNVVCNEIGTAGYKTEAIKAVTVSDRMYSWWCVLGSYRDTFGCDVVGGYDVNYKPGDNLSGFSTTFKSTVDSALGNYVVSNGGKIFSVGANNKTDYDKAGSGVVVQSGANRLANSGKTWKDILHYYLDNSTYNWPNAGIVKVG